MYMNEQLLEHICDAIRQTVPAGKIGVAFSGGVDSTLVARICADLNYDVTLLTTGFAGSHDVVFARQVSELLKLPHETLEIDPDGFSNIASKIKETIKTDNLSWNENSIAFYYVSKLAQSLKIDTIVTANGIDELFCGYNAYREAFSLGEGHILDVMRSKVKNEQSMMEAVNTVASEFEVRILQPLLMPEFVRYCETIPISEKIHGPDDLVRKHAIRSLARKIGIPEISAGKRKKALQYGSQIHKNLIKSI